MSGIESEGSSNPEAEYSSLRRHAGQRECKSLPFLVVLINSSANQRTHYSQTEAHSFRIHKQDTVTFVVHQIEAHRVLDERERMDEVSRGISKGIAERNPLQDTCTLCQCSDLGASCPDTRPPTLSEDTSCAQLKPGQ